MCPTVPNFVFLDNFNESQIPNFMKTCQVGAEVTHAGRRTDMTKVISIFHEYTNMPRKVQYIHLTRLTIKYVP